ncbi:hypothetical protein BDW59DRAFT_8472 [Aspergillus cavernicola]|uniref:EGF-like domain-containing protein n=1 Tax=Aspergillus cavernicola TaxID=176166 RepID=A0ABR4IWL6_9EURO
MNASHGWSDPSTSERKGSVRRAREMLESGRRPRIRVPQTNAAVPPPARAPQTNGWPLSNDHGVQTNTIDPQGRLSNMVDSQGRLWVPRGSPPQRPSRQDLPSPSVYSERSVSDAYPSPLHVHHAAPSFSQPLPNQQHIHPALREPVPIAKEDMFRKSAASSVGSIPSIPDFPPLLPSQNKTGSLAPPMRSIMNRISSVSPIPEELPDSPTILNKPYAPSRVTASSWNSEQRESDILGAYLDGDSDGAQESTSTTSPGEATLVRQASLGKRGKPSLRTISKPSVEAPQLAGNHGRPETPPGQITGASLKEIAAGLNNRDSFDSASSEESHFDPEKPPIVLGEDSSIHHSYNSNTRRSPEIQTGALPKRTPTLSEMRPGGRRPPRLNMHAVRDAEARGSLTSLSDLIKRATKLATNLEHGRTASRNDLLNVGGGAKFPFHRDPNRKSGSIKDILASFPNPAATPEGRSSWPIFWRRSTLHQLNSQEQGQEANQEKGSPRRRRCCGMPMWGFILICVILLLIIAAAVLLPIFLVVVPQENKSNDSSSMCGKTTTCANGGVSVSSGAVCSCVCVNGYTGSRCTTAGDASCITTEIAQGSSSRNATMGDDLPRLFQDSQDNFSISLDPITIMALFSQNNVSCTTENALVSFRGLSSDNNERRALSLDFIIADQLLSKDEELPASAPSYLPTLTVPVRRTVATENGIVFDDSAPSAGSTQSGEPTPTPTTKAQPTSTLDITDDVLNFSRAAVLYILQRTGELNAAMLSALSIQTHLENSYSNSTGGNFLIDLIPSGVRGNFTLDFDDFAITDFDGDTVGGS